MLEWLEARGPETLLFALVLSAARPLAFVIALPVFSRLGLQGGILRGALVIAFATPVFVALSTQLIGLPRIETVPFIGLLAKEALLGLLLALILGIPFWAIATAGDIIDMQRGANMSEMIEPTSGEETSPTGTFFFLLALLIVASSDWFRDIMLGNLYATYRIWPVMAPAPIASPEAGAVMLALLQDMLTTGLVLATPILIALILTELSLALIGRFLAQMNIMFLAMSAKQIIYILLMPIYFLSLIYFAERLFIDLDVSLETLGRLVTAPRGGE